MFWILICNSSKTRSLSLFEGFLSFYYHWYNYNALNLNEHIYSWNACNTSKWSEGSVMVELFDIAQSTIIYLTFWTFKVSTFWKSVMFQTEQNYVLFRHKSMISKAFPNHCVSLKSPCSSPPCKHDSFSFISLFHLGQEENVTMKSHDFKCSLPSCCYPSLWRTEGTTQERDKDYQQNSVLFQSTNLYTRTQSELSTK